MGFFDTIKQGIRNQFDNRKEERELMERLQKEADMQRRQAFEDQFRIDSKEVAIAQAKKEASEKSGLQKLRAMNRARNLSRNTDSPPGSFFETLGEYIRKNQVRREENLKRTEMLREEAKKMQKQTLENRRSGKEQRIAIKPFGNKRI